MHHIYNLRACTGDTKPHLSVHFLIFFSLRELKVLNKTIFDAVQRKCSLESGSQKNVFGSFLMTCLYVFCFVSVLKTIITIAS